jgi:carbonic anhydrase
MKITKFVVIGQLVALGGLLAIFAIKSSGSAVPHAAAATAAHATPAADKVPAKAEDHASAGHAAGKSGKAGKIAPLGGGGAAPAAAAPGHAAPGHGAPGHAAPGHGPVGPAVAMDPKAIAKALLEGNARFTSGDESHAALTDQREASAGGQHPGAMILGCADSRVPPELIFDRGIGELFVVRSAGNIAEPVSVGSLEYAAEHLHIKVLLVLGHDKCGAVQAALSETKMPSANLEALVGYVSPATKGLKAWADGPDLIRIAVEANVRRQAEEILRRSPILRAAVAKGEITLLKGVYDLETGRVRPL